MSRVAVRLLSLSISCILAGAAHANPSPFHRTGEESHAPDEAARAIVGGALTISVRNGLEFLRTDGDRWMRGEVAIQDGAACVSCHHVGYALWAHREAQRHGLVGEDPRIDDLQQRAEEFLLRPGKIRPVTATQLLLARGPHAEAFAAHLAESMERQGHWRARGQFPDQRRPEAESDATATFWALAAVTDTGLRTPQAIDAETEQARLKGLEWMRGADESRGIEWHAGRVVAEQLAGDRFEAAQRAKLLLALQNADGGWGWLPGEESSAFSTGQAIYALAGFDDRAVAGAIDRAAGFLLRTQQADGTWNVPSRLTSASPTAAKDEIYRFWGTAWAVLGLARGHDLYRAP